MIHLAAGYSKNVSGIAQMPSGRPDLRGVAVAKK